MLKLMKSEENKEEKEEEEVDLISVLPDCLLVEILSRLDNTKEAIRTGTLSKRWQNLWTYVHNLVFDRPYRNDSTSDFVSFVDKTLTHCRQLKLNKFDLDFFHDYKSQYDSQVNNWIRHAVNCKVEHLYLDFVNDESEAEFVLDDLICINSCFTCLYLSGCIFNPTGAISWKKITSLCLTYTPLDEALIENILSGCPVLETLELHKCYGYECVDVTSKSVKNFIFSGYSPPDGEVDDLDDIIEINAPHILSLKIYGDLLLWRLFLLNVSSLVKVELDYEKLGYDETTRKETEQEMLKGFILKLSHVKELKIGGSCYKAFFRLEAAGFSFPSNVVLDSVQVAADWVDCSDCESD